MSRPPVASTWWWAGDQRHVSTEAAACPRSWCVLEPDLRSHRVTVDSSPPTVHMEGRPQVTQGHCRLLAAHCTQGGTISGHTGSPLTPHRPLDTGRDDLRSHRVTVDSSPPTGYREGRSQVTQGHCGLLTTHWTQGGTISGHTGSPLTPHRPLYTGRDDLRSHRVTVDSSPPTGCGEGVRRSVTGNRPNAKRRISHNARWRAQWL